MVAITSFPEMRSHLSGNPAGDNLIDLYIELHDNLHKSKKTDFAKVSAAYVKNGDDTKTATWIEFQYFILSNEGAAFRNKDYDRIRNFS